MSLRRLAQAIVFGSVVSMGANLALAAMTWNAYSEFTAGPTAQADTNTWQYMYNTAGQNSGYALLDRWGGNGDGPLGDGWTLASSADYWKNELVMQDTATNHELVLHPFQDAGKGIDYAATVAWRSPITGTVNANFSVTDRNGGGGDGVEYSLYKNGAAAGTTLAHGYVDNGPDWTSGPVTANGISVAAGDTLYLQIGARGSYGYDLTGVSFSVTAVPEPTAMMLLGSGVIGLMAYAWRRRK